MESIGTRIKNARLSKNISLDKIAERTKLSKTVILQIEADQWERFPAPLYVIGFVENICDLVGLDAQPLVTEYKDWLIARGQMDRIPGINPVSVPTEEEEGENEQASLLERLREPFRRLPFSKAQRLIYLLVGGALVLFFVVFLVFRAFTRDTQRLITAENQSLKTSIYRMYGEKSSYDLKSGDVVRVFINDTIKLFTIQAIKPDQVSFTLESKSLTLAPEQSLLLDVDNDQVNDIEVKLKKVSGDLAIISFAIQNYREDKVDYGSILTNQERVTVGKEYFLFTQQEKYPITVYVRAATQPSHLSYTVDGKRENVTTLQTGAATLIKADEHVEIQIGNFRSAELVVNKIPINLTTDSEKFSITKIIKWVPDPNNETKFDLVIKDYLN